MFLCFILIDWDEQNQPAVLDLYWVSSSMVEAVWCCGPSVRRDGDLRGQRSKHQNCQNLYWTFKRDWRTSQEHWIEMIDSVLIGSGWCWFWQMFLWFWNAGPLTNRTGPLWVLVDFVDDRSGYQALTDRTGPGRAGAACCCLLFPQSGSVSWIQTGSNWSGAEPEGWTLQVLKSLTLLFKTVHPDLSVIHSGLVTSNTVSDL